MTFSKIMAIMEKEFDEIMKNKMIMGSIFLLPLLFSIIIPAAMIAPIAFEPSAFSQNDTIKYVGMLPGAVASDSPQVVMIKFFTAAVMPLFMMLPAMLPAVISAYSIIGEKRNRTLEPLLAAPVTEYDIMIGKTLSAIIPALLATWISALLLFGSTALITSMAMHVVVLPDPILWATGMLITAPALSFLAIMFTIIVSSRVNDPRVAQQLSALLIIPIMGVFFVEIAGLIMLDVRTIIILSVFLIALDAVALRVGKALFEREEILTRWK